MTHGIAPNGGGSLRESVHPDHGHHVSVRTVPGNDRALWQTSQCNANDADLFVDSGNGIGTSSTYHGTILDDTWHRVAFVFDLTLTARTG